MALNHLFFMDDPKLFPYKTGSLSKLLSKTKKFFTKVRLGLNVYRFTRSNDYTEVKTLNELLIVNAMKCYKYLEFFKAYNILQIAKKKKLIQLVYERVARIIAINLSGKSNSLDGDKTH